MKHKIKRIVETIIDVFFLLFVMVLLTAFLVESRIKLMPKVGEWIPCSERLPEELVPVNVTWTNRNPSFYYRDIKDKPFTATAVYCNEKWFWWSSICEDILAEYGRNDDEMVDEDVEILAWMPLPEAYKESKL